MKQRKHIIAIAARWEDLAKGWKITARSMEQDGIEGLAGHYAGAANTALLCARELRAALTLKTITHSPRKNGKLK